MHSASFFSLVLIAVFLLTVGFAGVFGRRAERVGAALLALNVAFSLTAQLVIEFAPLYGLLAVDLATFIGLAWLTLSYPGKLWPGLAACAQLLVTMFSITRTLEFPLTDNQYLLMVSTCSMLTALALFGGTLVTRFFPRPPSAWDIAFEESSRPA